MIRVSRVSMGYPKPKRYRELLFKPFSRRKRIRALESIELSVHSGERVAFLGPNGAGKTTLLKLIAGLLLPTGGHILVNGFDTMERNDEVRESCSLVMNEERSFYWRLTGLENLEFFGALQDLSGRNLKERIGRSLDIVGLVDEANLPVAGYSSGMKQRLAIARALLVDAPILILDEPTRALDPRGAEDLMALILDTLHRDLEKTLLIATHRLDEVTTLCDRVVVLSSGRIVADESVSGVLDRSRNMMDFYKDAVDV